MEDIKKRGHVSDGRCSHHLGWGSLVAYAELWTLSWILPSYHCHGWWLSLRWPLQFQLLSLFHSSYTLVSSPIPCRSFSKTENGSSLAYWPWEDTHVSSYCFSKSALVFHHSYKFISASTRKPFTSLFCQHSRFPREGLRFRFIVSPNFRTHLPGSPSDLVTWLPGLIKEKAQAQLELKKLTGQISLKKKMSLRNPKHPPLNLPYP